MNANTMIHSMQINDQVKQMKSENLNNYLKAKILTDIERNQEIIEKVQYSKAQTAQAQMQCLNNKQKEVSKQKQ